MRNNMNTLIQLLGIVFLSNLLLACDDIGHYLGSDDEQDTYGVHEEEIEKGIHGGRLLSSGDFTLELAI